MRESALWHYVRKGMVGKWHVSRIESSGGNGVPDVSFGIPRINGWIELKYRDEWPKRNTTKVKIPLRPEQKHWIRARMETAGNVWVLFRIDQDFFLVTGWQALDNLNDDGWSKEQWCDKYPFMGYWNKAVDFNEMERMLKNGC